MAAESTKERTIELYTPHRGQMRLHNSRKRFRVGACGRRFGKTLGAGNELVKGAIERRRTLNWWVSPTYRQAESVFELMANATYDLLAKKPNWTKLRLDYSNGSIIECRSAERYNNLRGDGVQRLVMDECRDIHRAAWQEVLMPMLADTNGDAVFISSPRGHDWFYELALLGMDPLEPDWDFFSFPTMANPYIPLAFIEDMREKLPDDVFRQEILAEFLADGARVFKNVDTCIAGELEDPKPGHHYIVGYDPAKHTDFAVMIVFDCDTKHVVGFLRSKNVEYLDQVQRLVLLAHLYNHASIIMDSTGVGDPLLEQVKSISNEMGDELVVEGFLFTQTSKKELVQRLMVGIERRQFTFPAIPELVSELKAFGYQISASRNIVYSAPEGAHDDCVMALGLAIFGAKLGSSIPLLRSTRGSSNSQEGIPAIRKFEDVPEDTQKELARRQAITSRVLSQVLGNSPWR